MILCFMSEMLINMYFIVTTINKTINVSFFLLFFLSLFRTETLVFIHHYNIKIRMSHFERFAFIYNV